MPYAATLADLTGDGVPDFVGCWNYAYRPGSPWDGIVCYPAIGEPEALVFGDLVRVRYVELFARYRDRDGTLRSIQDYRDAQSRRWPKLPGVTHASIFGYLYHEFLAVFQSNPRPGDRRNLAYCAVNGQIPHWVPHWPVTPSPALVNGDLEQWTLDVPDGWQRVTGWQGIDYAGRSMDRKPP